MSDLKDEDGSVPGGAGPTTDEAKCLLCGELMPPGEEIFNYHGYSGPCPKRMETSCESENRVKELERITAERDAFVAAVKDYRQHFEVDPFSPDAALAADIALDEALSAGGRNVSSKEQCDLVKELERLIAERDAARAENESLWRVVAAARDDLKCNRDAHCDIFQETDAEWLAGCTETEKNLIAAIANLASLRPKDSW